MANKIISKYGIELDAELIDYTENTEMAYSLNVYDAKGYK